MKKTIILISALFYGSALYAQQVPTINAPPNGGHTSNQFWSRTEKWLLPNE